MTGALRPALSGHYLNSPTVQGKVIYQLERLAAQYKVTIIFAFSSYRLEKQGGNFRHDTIEKITVVPALNLFDTPPILRHKLFFFKG